jgi:hypothetical protein
MSTIYQTILVHTVTFVIVRTAQTYGETCPVLVIGLFKIGMYVFVVVPSLFPILPNSQTIHFPSLCRLRSPFWNWESNWQARAWSWWAMAVVACRRLKGYSCDVWLLVGYLRRDIIDNKSCLTLDSVGEVRVPFDDSTNETHSRSENHNGVCDCECPLTSL